MEEITVDLRKEVFVFGLTPKYANDSSEPENVNATDVSVSGIVLLQLW